MVLVDTSVLIPFFNGKKIEEVNKLEYIIRALLKTHFLPLN